MRRVKTSVAILLFVGIAIGALIMGAIRSGADFLNMTPAGRIALLVIALIIGLGALGAYFYSKRERK